MLASSFGVTEQESVTKSGPLGAALGVFTTGKFLISN
jgi:hypothetical protein